MLPFLKPKAAGSILNTVRKSDGTEEPQDNDYNGLSDCAAELIRAVHAKDETAVANALKDAIEILKSEPDTQDESEE